MPIIRTGHTGFGEASDRLTQGVMQGAQLRALRERAIQEEEAFQKDIALADAQTELVLQRARMEGLEADTLEQAYRVLAGDGPEGQAAANFLRSTDDSGAKLTALSRLRRSGSAAFRRVVADINETAQLQMEAEQATALAGRMNSAPWWNADGAAPQEGGGPGDQFLVDLGRGAVTYEAMAKEDAKRRDAYAELKENTGAATKQVETIRREIAESSVNIRDSAGLGFDEAGADPAKAAKLLARMEAEMEAGEPDFATITNLYGQARAALLDPATKQEVLKEAAIASLPMPSLAATNEHGLITETPGPGPTPPMDPAMAERLAGFDELFKVQSNGAQAQSPIAEQRAKLQEALKGAEGQEATNIQGQLDALDRIEASQSGTPEQARKLEALVQELVAHAPPHQVSSWTQQDYERNLRKLVNEAALNGADFASRWVDEFNMVNEGTEPAFPLTRRMREAFADAEKIGGNTSQNNPGFPWESKRKGAKDNGEYFEDKTKPLGKTELQEGTLASAPPAKRAKALKEVHAFAKTLGEQGVSDAEAIPAIEAKAAELGIAASFAELFETLPGVEGAAGLDPESIEYQILMLGGAPRRNPLGPYPDKKK